MRRSRSSREGPLARVLGVCAVADVDGTALSPTPSMRRTSRCPVPGSLSRLVALLLFSSVMGLVLAVTTAQLGDKDDAQATSYPGVDDVEWLLSAGFGTRSSTMARSLGANCSSGALLADVSGKDWWLCRARAAVRISGSSSEKT